jgi:hypothetical protein
MKIVPTAKPKAFFNKVPSAGIVKVSSIHFREYENLICSYLGGEEEFCDAESNVTIIDEKD